MAFIDPTTPSLADYQTFLYSVVGFTTAQLPANSDVITMSYNVALAIVNDDLQVASGILYTLAVYNLGADRVINFAPDVSNQTYFQDLRAKLNINVVSVGVASSANDQGTSIGILNPEAMQSFTMQDLQTLKTTYGRQYMAFAQMYGSRIWGLT